MTRTVRYTPLMRGNSDNSARTVQRYSRGKINRTRPDHKGVLRLSEKFEVDALQTRPGGGGIPSQKVGRHLRFHRELIDGWLGVRS